MLLIHAGKEQREKDWDLEQILWLQVQSYFSRYEDPVAQKPVQDKLHRLLEHNSFEHWDGSEVALAVSLAIMESTKEMLPGFASHKRSHCQEIQDIAMLPNQVARIDMTSQGWEQFSKPSSTFKP